MHPPIPSLTGLRFIAALSVVISHSVVLLLRFPGVPPFWHIALSQLSGIGMPLFFVLSGFVIQYNYSDAISAKPAHGLYGFFIARFARLYPLYIVCLAFDLGFKWGYRDLPAATGEALPFYLTLTQSWFYIHFNSTDLIRMFGLMPQISWSISTEFFFYLCYPTVCLLLVRLQSTRAVIVAIATLSVVGTASMVIFGLNYSTILRIGAAWFGPQAADSPDDVFQWFVYISPYVELLEFILGCLCASLLMRLVRFPVTRSEQYLGLIVTLTAIATIASLYCTYFLIPFTASLDYLQGLRASFGFAPPIAVLIFCCARYRNPIVSFLSLPKIVLCGEASYSIYMLHYLVIDAFRLRVGPIDTVGLGFANLLMWMITVASIIGLSLVSWQIIEVPARRWLRKALGPKNRKTTVPQPAE
jgi:peptidoglycan/LPS O-acetylase OafA/YrhL